MPLVLFLGGPKSKHKEVQGSPVQARSPPWFYLASSMYPPFVCAVKTGWVNMAYGAVPFCLRSIPSPGGKIHFTQVEFYADKGLHLIWEQKVCSDESPELRHGWKRFPSQKPSSGPAATIAEDPELVINTSPLKTESSPAPALVSAEHPELSLNAPS